MIGNGAEKAACRDDRECVCIVSLSGRSRRSSGRITKELPRSRETLPSQRPIHTPSPVEVSNGIFAFSSLWNQCSLGRQGQGRRLVDLSICRLGKDGGSAASSRQLAANRAVIESTQLLRLLSRGFGLMTQ